MARNHFWLAKAETTCGFSSLVGEGENCYSFLPLTIGFFLSSTSSSVLQWPKWDISKRWNIFFFSMRHWGFELVYSTHIPMFLTNWATDERWGTSLLPSPHLDAPCARHHCNCTNYFLLRDGDIFNCAMFWRAKGHYFSWFRELPYCWFSPLEAGTRVQASNLVYPITDEAHGNHRIVVLLSFFPFSFCVCLCL